jgi:hypothetical protein
MNAARKKATALHTAASRISYKRALLDFVAKAELGQISWHKHAPSFAIRTILARKECGALRPKITRGANLPSACAI